MKKLEFTNGYIITEIKDTTVIKRNGFLEIYNNGIKILTLNNEKDIKKFLQSYGKEFEKYNDNNTEV